MWTFLARMSDRAITLVAVPLPQACTTTQPTPPIRLTDRPLRVSTERMPTIIAKLTGRHKTKMDFKTRPFDAISNMTSVLKRFDMDRSMGSCGAPKAGHRTMDAFAG